MYEVLKSRDQFSPFAGWWGWWYYKTVKWVREGSKCGEKVNKRREDEEEEEEVGNLIQKSKI